MRVSIGDYIRYSIPKEWGGNISEGNKTVIGRVIGEYPCFYLIDLGKYRDTIHKRDLNRYQILKREEVLPRFKEEVNNG